MTVKEFIKLLEKYDGEKELTIDFVNLGLRKFSTEFKIIEWFNYVDIIPAPPKDRRIKMKDKEFIKRVEELGFEVFNGDDYFFIKNEHGCAVANVNKTTLTQMSTDYTSYEEVCDKDKTKLFKLLTEFAATPIYDREDEKKFYLKHKFLCDNVGGSSHLYLNYRINDNCYFIYNSKQNEGIQTQFTLKEIEEIEDKFDTNLDDFELIEVK